MRQILEASGQKGAGVKPIFEINPQHPLIESLTPSRTRIALPIFHTSCSTRPRWLPVTVSGPGGLRAARTSCWSSSRPDRQTQ